MGRMVGGKGIEKVRKGEQKKERNREKSKKGGRRKSEL